MSHAFIPHRHRWPRPYQFIATRRGGRIGAPAILDNRRANLDFLQTACQHRKSRLALGESFTELPELDQARTARRVDQVLVVVGGADEHALALVNLRPASPCQTDVGLGGRDERLGVLYLRACDRA